MKGLILIFTALSLFTGVALGLVPHMPLAAGQDDKAGVTSLLNDYARAFGKLDVQAILPYYHEPSVLITTRGVATMPTHAAMAVAFKPLMDGLRARGYARSEFTTLNVKRLSATTALASGAAVRYKADGQELERLGATYVLHKTENGWKIAVTVGHDVENVIRLE
jgi:ketosteroid isomerase-like protein